jgi:chaperonin GroEL (HSP60 family)
VAGWSRRYLPCLVIRAALQGAVSVAGLQITTETMEAEAPSKNAPRAFALRWRSGF